MKLIRKITLGLLATMVLASATFLIIADLYTKDKVDKLTNNLVRSFYYDTGNYRNPQSTPNPLMLGGLLYANIHANEIAGEQMYAGDYTPEHYKLGFRDMLVKNPALAYKAWDLYGKLFIDQFNSKLKKLYQKRLNEYSAMDFRTDTSSYQSRYHYVENEAGKKVRMKRTIPLEVFTYKHYTKGGVYKSEKIGENHHIYYPLGAVQDSLKAFDLDRYWRNQKQVVHQYQKLLDALIKLDDKTLNRYMTEIKERFTDFGYNDNFGDVHKWLVQKKLMPPKPKDGYDWSGDPIKDGAWDFLNYPVDLLFLAVRIHKDYPDTWPYLAFFKECKKFVAYVEDDLP